MKGTWRNNYVSAEAHAYEVESVLVDQAERGQVEILTEADALKKYGERLTVASLGAVAKCVREDGSTEVRIVHDGTHGITLNSAIKVRDQVAHPTALDVRRILQECAQSRVPFFGAAIDVKEAHRQIRTRPQDVALQACQLHT